MSKKVIDVSSYQGVIHWNKVKAAGIHGAIPKIIRKDLSPDKQFEANWAGCEAAGMPIIGVYNYSYATSIPKARMDAQKVISTLGGRKTKVWMDVEDACMKGLGSALISIIDTYLDVIEGAGLESGVYTGLSFYNSYIKPYAGRLDCGFWVARYPNSSAMTVLANPVANKRPDIQHTLEGWQYSSKGSVSGVSGAVDMNLWYGEDILEAKPALRNPYSKPVRVIYYRTVMMYGDDVRWVQWHLVRLGFLPALNSKGKSNIDGWCGSATSAAIIAAQRYFGIKKDGKAGAVTNKCLETT